MNDDFLKVKLERVVRRYHRLALWRKLAACWAVAALVGAGLVWLERMTGWSSPFILPGLAALAGAAATALAIRHFEQKPDLRWVARKIEDKYPELKGVLLTAVQQHLESGAEPNFLQYRVLQEATARSQEHDWREVVPTARLATMQVVHLVALACLGIVLFTLREQRVPRSEITKGGWVGADGVTVTPGDASVERGESLVVFARFARTLPPSVGLVVRQDGVPERTVPLVKSLADPVFGGSVTEVAGDFTYHLEYRGQRTRDFKVTVFEHPRLVRADVDLTFPDYTKLPPKHIEDTRRVSAVQGTKLDYALQLNKPVKSAKLVARDATKTEIPLRVEPGKAVALLPAFAPEKSQTYDLQLVDADGRANKVASSFSIDVQPNRPPELRLTSPRGDVRPSALEEIAFDGTVWDDFGTLAYGLSYAVAGGEEKSIELGKDVAAKEKKSFNHLLKLEELGAKPDDLIAWHVWADDIGPDGKVRRTNGDLFFAEVRPFDEIFRESQNMQSQSQQQQQQQQGQGNQRRRLTETQKQIISATWKLQRDGQTPKYADDAKVVLDSQQQLLTQAQEAQENASSPREQALWIEATKQMTSAIEKLGDAAKAPAPLAQALPPEQSAYQALLKLQSRETNVTRGQNQRGGGGGGQQANQRQIDQLDLQQSENRYETQRQAQAPQTPQRRDQLAVMNRLQELARRQQDLNERLKELQTSLQEAQTEQQRDEIRRQLKRLEEEQRQMLADADEVRQRMDRAENQSSMSDQRQQLDQTREDLQRAADAAASGSVAQALASGTRAQRQLQNMREELRKQNSSQFADDLRDMRAEARELSRQQEELGQKLDRLAAGNTGLQRKSLSDAGDNQELRDQLAQQKERMNNLVNRAEQISEQAENSEPLLSRSLEESVKKLSQDDIGTVKQMRDEMMREGRFDLRERLQQMQERDAGGRALDLTGEMLKEGFLPQAAQAGQRARGEIDDLRRGVERAAESVLGDDTEQLKLAQSELDQLAQELEREIAQSQAGQNGAPGGTSPGGRARQGDRRQAGGANDSANASQTGEQAGDENQPPGEQKGGRARQVARNDSQNGQRGQRGDPSQQGDRAGGQQAGQQGEQQRGDQAGGDQTGGDRGQMANDENRNRANPAGDRQNQAGQDAAGNRAGRGGQQGGQAGGRQIAGGRGGRNQAGGDRAPTLEELFNGGATAGADRGGDGRGGGGAWNGGPLLGDEFGPWVDRLRNVEDLLDAPDLRDAVADARERARLLRRDFKQDLKKPDWANVQLQILKPLVEVRSRVAEELARRDSKESLAPIDRDPVPNRFADSVRKYYEELGKDRTEAAR
jgi:predicted nuclease with TOPRIM domain